MQITIDTKSFKEFFDKNSTPLFYIVALASIIIIAVLNNTISDRKILSRVEEYARLSAKYSSTVKFTEERISKNGDGTYTATVDGTSANGFGTPVDFSAWCDLDEKRVLLTETCRITDEPFKLKIF